MNKLLVPCARFKSCIFLTKPQAQKHQALLTDTLLISSESPAKIFCLESIIPSLFLILILLILMREISITIIIQKLVMREFHVTNQCFWQPGHNRFPQPAPTRQKCHPRDNWTTHRMLITAGKAAELHSSVLGCKISWMMPFPRDFKRLASDLTDISLPEARRNDSLISCELRSSPRK